jgi:hypothetical protein
VKEYEIGKACSIFEVEEDKYNFLWESQKLPKPFVLSLAVKKCEG